MWWAVVLGTAAMAVPLALAWRRDPAASPERRARVPLYRVAAD